MRADLHSEITRRVLADYGFKEKGTWLQEGRCPDCRKKELYAKAEAPWVLRCGRVNNCGAEIHVKDLYADLFESWSDRYRVTEANPTAAADAYLREARGFDLTRLRGLYSQESYRDIKKKISSATVRFPLACGSWWERIIDRPQRFDKKANFAYGKSYKGHWWELPDSPTDKADLWLVEGIFDAIAIEYAGHAARALLSCNNYPGEALKALAEQCKADGRPKPRLVFALDGDAAGRDYTRKWVERARKDSWEATAAQIPQKAGSPKRDWNDLHQREGLGEKALERYLYEGALLVAESVVDKALLIYNRSGRSSFHVHFGKRLYWWEYNDAAYRKIRERLEGEDTGLTEAQIREQALMESGSISEIANCDPRPLFFMENKMTDESWYYMRIGFPHGGPDRKCTFTAGQLASGPEFKKRLLGTGPGAVFTGSTQQLDRIYKDTLYGIKVVETVDFIGYSRDHGCWMLGDVAVKDGQIHNINSDDYFDLSKRLSLKSLNQSVGLSINTVREDYRRDWLDMLWACFGPKGVVALAFWLGSLYAEQIRAAHKSYPFLEVVGEAGSGKSTLIEFLWKLCGRRDYEGFDPSKSTAAARARNFAQVSGLPVVLIEGDRETDGAKQRAFDWNELKTAYNGRSVRATGVKNAGNETREPPFRGAIVISQNAEVSSSDAILQRIVHLSFDRAAHTPETRALAEQLERMPVDEVSGWILAAVTREAAVLDALEKHAKAHEDLLLSFPEIGSVRIAKNHSQLMALVDALRLVTPMTDSQHDATHALLIEMAMERQRAINADHPHVIQFWDLFEHVDSFTEEKSLNHAPAGSDYLYISLVEMESRLGKKNLRLPVEAIEMRKLLRGSRRHRFVDVKTVHSAITGASKKCWVFARGKA